MICLSLDTTTRDGSVALVVDDRVVEERRGDAARSHAERLPADLVAVAADHGIAPRDVDLFAVAVGPGSFTGLRIGIATIQGLAFATGRRVVGVSALDAMAHVASLDVRAGALVAAWMDAFRSDVFAALYRVEEAPAFDPARLVVLEPPTVGGPAEIAERWRRGAHGAPDVFVGDGAARYAAIVAAKAPAARVAGLPTLAAAIGRLALARAGRGEAGDPAAIQSLYVRRPDAEIDREKRAQESAR